MRSSESGVSDIMGQIEHLVRAGMPKEHLVQLSAALFAAGKAARRVGAPAGQLADWRARPVPTPVSRSRHARSRRRPPAP
jgi:hypothetical protein